jgi:hypothetical protein
MSYLPGTAASVSTDWSGLVDELDQWGEAGRIAALWWRDDDAVATTPQLETLMSLADGIPVALAVIPALARPELAEALSNRPRIGVLQHGWKHMNRAGCGKKTEYPANRPPDEVANELAAGRARLTALFDGQALPVLVPPWNRFAARYLPLLADVGIAGLSGMASRQPSALPPGLGAIDVHVDLVAWRGDRGFVGEAAALAGLVAHLRARRLGAAPMDRPVGILTHHLIMDRPTARFIERLIAVTAAHQAARWMAAGELLQ